VRQHPLEASEDIRVLSLLSALKLVKAAKEGRRLRRLDLGAGRASCHVLLRPDQLWVLAP